MLYEKNIAKYYDLLYSYKKYKEEVEFIKQITGEINSKKILDIGCGTGTHSILLSQCSPESITGIDISKGMINIAKNKKYDNDILRFIVSDIESVEERNYDLVISMFNVVNHLPTLNKFYSFLEETRKRIKKGGVFIFDSWNEVATISEHSSRRREDI